MTYMQRYSEIYHSILCSPVSLRYIDYCYRKCFSAEKSKKEAVLSTSTLCHDFCGPAMKPCAFLSRHWLRRSFSQVFLLNFIVSMGTFVRTRVSSHDPLSPLIHSNRSLSSHQWLCLIHCPLALTMYDYVCVGFVQDAVSLPSSSVSATPQTLTPYSNITRCLSTPPVMTLLVSPLSWRT